MKITHLFLLLGLVFLAACKDDENPTPTGATTLKYDAGNVSGPLLDAGNHELAVRFPASTMADHVGKKLTEVQVFVGNVPQSCHIKIYAAADPSTPGPKLYDGNVLSTMTAGEWNKFKITPGIDITGEDIWIGVEIQHAVNQQSIGCDSGPRKTNADWLYSESDQSWRTYQERTGESVNWNIRAYVE